MSRQELHALSFQTGYYIYNEQSKRGIYRCLAPRTCLYSILLCVFVLSTTYAFPVGIGKQPWPSRAPAVSFQELSIRLILSVSQFCNCCSIGEQGNKKKCKRYISTKCWTWGTFRNFYNHSWSFTGSPVADQSIFQLLYENGQLEYPF